MKIISTVALQPAHRALITAAAPDAEVIDRQCRTNDEVLELVAGGCDAMLTFRTPDDIARKAPGLRWIQLLSAGADHVPAAVLSDRALAITTSSGIHATPIAEYTIASMLAYAHGLHITLRAQMRREWMRSGQFMTSIDELRGHTLGVIGYGSIGRETARIAAALGMRVLALKRNPDVHEDPGWIPEGVGDRAGTIPERYFGPAECAEILAESDYVTVTLPNTPHTRKFIGARELAAMRPAAYIVNIGRGEVIDEHALAETLRAKKIGGAGLDVFEHEPLEANSPLWDMENVILTPHMSGANRGYVEKACQLFADNLLHFRAGQPLLNIVDPALGY